MAVLLQITVAPASQDQFNELDARVGQSMEEAEAHLRASCRTWSTPRARAS